MKATISIAIVGLAAISSANYTVSLVASGLNRPTGIAVSGGGNGTKVFFTETPTPGVPGSMGGMNSVSVIRPNGQISLIHEGEPDPVNIAVGQGGRLYWTCRSAGVILAREPSGSIAPILTGLVRPNGLAISRCGTLYFTQLPTPGIPGSMGGMNTVSLFNGGASQVLTLGEPEPTDIAVDEKSGSIYWTCKSAGVILERDKYGQVSLFMAGLNKPTGIAADQRGNLVFTEVPTPGVPGSMGGTNAIWKVDIETKSKSLVNFGDPEPTDVAVSMSGSIYWTCTSAGVIVRADS